MSFELRIPPCPIRDKYILQDIRRAIEMYKSMHLNGINWDIFVGGARIRQYRAKFLKALMWLRKPHYTVELGSGASTQLFASMVGASHTAFDHLEKYWRRTTCSLATLGLTKGRVLLRPLQSQCFLEGSAYGKYMYEIQPVHDIPPRIDLLFIDGPPYHPLIDGKPRYSRVATLPFFMPYLADNAIVLMDSTERDPEQECLQIWADELGVTFENPEPMKGLAVIDPWGHG
jgi:predicted O-methyltransferase YrrM